MTRDTDSTRTWTPIAPTSSTAAPAGAYSPGVRAGDFIFVSGQVPKDPATGEMVSGEVEAQTRQVIENIRSVLGAAGASLSDIVSMTVYLSDPGLWGRFNAVYKEIMPTPYPSRTAVGVALRGIDVEITAIAYVKR